jgi:hypothetical protein
MDYLGDRYVDLRVTDEGLVIGVHGLSSAEINDLKACGVYADVVARPVSLGALVAAGLLVIERLSPMVQVHTAGHDAATGTVTATVSPDDLDLAIALAAADSELSEMMATPPSTLDKVSLVFAEGAAVVPAPDPTVTAFPPVLHFPEIGVTPLTVAPGGTVQVSLAGTNSGLAVTAVLRPGETVLAEWVADNAGNVAASITLPAGLAAGDYVLAFVYRVGQAETPLGSVAIKVAQGSSVEPPSSATDVPDTRGLAGVGLVVLVVVVALVGVGAATVRRRSADS